MNVSSMIDKTILTRYLKEEEVLDYQEMGKVLKREREKIIKEHVENIHPILKLNTGIYYTKMTPHDRNHSGKISAKDIDVLHDKIVAYYLNIKTRDLTMHEVLEKVRDDYVKNRQEETGKRHMQRFDKYFSRLRNIPVSNLKKQDIEYALKELVALEITRKEYTNAVGALNRIYDYCMSHDIACINIRQVIKDFASYHLNGKHTFKQTRKRHRDMAFSEVEAKALIKDALDNPSYLSLFVGLALTTGCRAGELLCMSYDNVDLDTHYFIVEESEDKDGHIHPFVKCNQAREVYLDSNAMRLIQKLLEVRGEDMSNSRYLFLNGANKLHRWSAYKYLHRRQKELGFDKTKKLKGLHDCRRTYASIAYLKGVKLQLISAQLGHKTVTQTWDYIKDIADVQTRAAELDKGCIDL